VDATLTSPFLEPALDYARAGWRIFPVRPDAKQPPLVRRWPEVATTEPETVRRMWGAFPRANVGVATGNGLAVIDIDTRSGGFRDASWPATLTARTPSGGLHLYYVVGEPVRNSVDQLAVGVDVRGDGGYVLAPPSAVDGRPYTWLDTRAPVIAEAEMFLAPGEAVRRDRQGGIVRPPYEPPEQPVTRGGRHNELLRYAGWLRSVYEDDELEEAIHEFNEVWCSPPLPEKEVAAIAYSAVRWQP
jgi:hypothetical protein